MAGQGDQISRMGDEEFESDHISRVGKILSKLIQQDSC